MASFLQFVSRLVLRYHRWIGLMAALPVILWGLSGLSHPVMSRLQPQPAAMMPPAGMLSGFTQDELTSIRSLSALLPGQGIHLIRQARLLRWQGKPVWQLTLPDQPERVYLDAVSGQILRGVDQVLAERLARHFSGEPNRDIASVELVTRFSADYPYVNRLLPVWRVEFAGGDRLRAFVETSPLRLATLDNFLKSGFGKTFRTLHSWAFIANEVVRDTAMTFFLVLAFLSGLGGLWLYGFFWRKPANGERGTSVRRWHRRLGLLVAVTTLTFTSSAILHVQLLDKGSDEALPLVLSDQLLRADSLRWTPAAMHLMEAGLTESEQLDILSLAGQAVVRVSVPSPSMVGRKGNGAMPATEGRGEHAHHHPDGDKSLAQHAGIPQQPAEERYFSAASGEPLAEGPQQHARALAAAFAGIPADRIVAAEKVTKFAGEYGFINKRLPVWRVTFNTPDNLAVYVETTSGVQAAAVRDVQRLEGFSFAYLHKWNFLDVIGKDGRDLLIGLFALLNVVVAALGLGLWLRRRKTVTSA